MKGTMWTILLVAALGGCSDTDHPAATEKQASAQSGVATAFELRAGAVIAARCMDCHGAKGVSITPNIPHLAGQHQQYLANMARSYKSGQRDNPAMHAVMSGMTKEEINAVAAYYAVQAKAPTATGTKEVSHPVALTPTLVKELDKCDRCHGKKGFGDASRFPILAGQHEEYLRGALHAYKGQFLRESSMMHAMTDLLDQRTAQQLAAYYAAQSTGTRVGGSGSTD